MGSVVHNNGQNKHDEATDVIGTVSAVPTSVSRFVWVDGVCRTETRRIGDSWADAWLEPLKCEEVSA